METFSCSSTTKLEPQDEIVEPVELSKTTNKTEYNKWTYGEQKMLVDLWSKNHGGLESIFSRGIWKKMCEEINQKYKGGKTVDKCIRKMKHLRDKYKEAREWNQNPTRTFNRSSPYYEQIDSVLGSQEAETYLRVANVVVCDREVPVCLTGNTERAFENQNGPVTRQAIPGLGYAPRYDQLQVQAHEQTQRQSTEIGEINTDSGPGNENRGTPVDKTPVNAQAARKTRKKNIKRKFEDENDNEEKKLFKQTVEVFQRQGERMASAMERMCEDQNEQFKIMSQFLGAFVCAMSVQATQEKNASMDLD